MRAKACLLVVFATIARADSPNTIEPYAPLQVDVNKAFAAASGAWDWNISATSRNAVTIQCSPFTKECVEAIALADPSTELFSVALQYWRVTSWTDTEVVAVNVEACSTTTLTINAPYKEVTSITRNGGSAQRRCAMAPLDKPIIRKLLGAVPFGMAGPK